MTTSARIDATKLDRIRVLDEDDELLIIDKPAGLAVHPGADVKRSVIEILGAAYPDPNNTHLHLVHRLDRGTSGVLAVAKSRAAAARLSENWDQAQKTYVAVVFGEGPKEMTIETPLEDRAGIERAAVTHLRPLGDIRDIEPAVSLVALELGSGRMHQIRRHLASEGHPVVLDDKHGQFKLNKQLARGLKARDIRPPKFLLLHAVHLRLLHPRTGARVGWTSPVPDAWALFVGRSAENGQSAPGLVALLRELS